MNADPEHGRQKYLFFSPWAVRPGGGVNNVMVGLSAELQNQYQPQFITTGWTPPVDGSISLKLPSVEFAPLKFASYLLRFLPNSLRLLSISKGAAAINAHYFGTELLPVALLRKMRLLPKLILSVHGADVTEAAQSGPLSRSLYRFICTQADAVISCSDALGKQVKELSPEARIHTVWNGVSPVPAVFGPRPIGDRYLVSVAAFVKKKGHDVLLQAFGEIASEYPALKLVLIGGDGPERAAVTEQIKAAGLEDRVQMIVDLGHDEVWDWVHHAECFVHAAREEPFGIAILEAALAETPVVATAVGGIREYLSNGVDGLTCPADDPQQFAALVRETLSDPAAARARAIAFRQKAGRFTWQAAWERYRQVAGL